MAATNAAAEYVSYYKAERQVRTLDPTQVAVRMAADPLGQKADFEAMGLVIENREAMDLASWWRIPVRKASRSGPAIEALVASLAARPDVAFASPVFEGDLHGTVVLTGSLMVGFDKGVSRSRAESLILALDKDADLGDHDWAGMEGTYLVELSTRNGFTAQEIANDLARSGDSLFAELDRIVTGRLDLIPNDPGLVSQWGLHNTGQNGGTVDVDMDAQEAWDTTTGSATVPVAVFDVGVQQDHPDLNLIPGVDVTSQGPGNGGPVEVCDDHGTLVAGAVSAIINNALDGTGVAPSSPVFSVRMSITTECATGGFSTSFSWIITGLSAAEDAGCRVSNHSYHIGATSAALDAKFALTRANGMVHFAATGNNGTGTIGYPASVPEVNAVGAVTSTGLRADFSQYGAGTAFVAPGQDIWTTDRTGADGEGPGDFESANGTSLASPYAAGVAALSFSVNPSLAAAEVEGIMQASAVDMGDPGYDTEYGYGLVNAANVVTETPCLDPTVAVNALSFDITAGLDGTGSIPFQVGNNGTCESLVWNLVEENLPGGGDCPWLTPSAVSGSEAPLSSRFYDLAVDASGFAPGFYLCDLFLSSNDPVRPQLVISVSLEVTGTIAPAVGGWVYATQGFSGTGELLRMYPGIGTAHVIGNTGVSGMPGLAINGAGEIFGLGGPDNTGTMDLFRIDGVTGAAYFIGNTGVQSFQAMAFSPGGILYGIGGTDPDVLYTINSATGGATAGPAIDLSITGMGFDPTTGILYGTEFWDGGSGDNLLVIDTVTGAMTLVGSLGLGVGIGDIAFDRDGNLHGVVGGGQTANSFVSVDKISGAATVVGPTGIGSLTGLDTFMMAASSVPDIEKPLPVSYLLHGAFPNPFNPATKISYELPRESHVTISVYDTAGRRVKTIVDGVQSAGTHEVMFRADRLSSGVYFYEMRTGDFQEIRKMMLVK